ncbi:MAG: DUF6544 family protein [Thermomicrobiales bacterium]
MTSGDELPEPVQRYLTHALPSGAAVPPGVELTMSGRIKVGVWLPFVATQRCDGKSFVWRASVRLGPVRALVVTDRYENGTGSMTGRLLGRWTLFEQADANVVRSAAGRAGLESVWAPGSLLPGRGYTWRVEGEDHIVAITDNDPEHVEVHMRIARDGRLLSVSAQRWGEVAKGAFDYLPFGGDVHEEQRFGELVLPRRLVAGWGYGTDKYVPFFNATVTTAKAV